MKRILQYGLIALFCACLPSAVQAAAELPEAVTMQAGTQLEKVGEGTYHKLGFSVYHAILWAPGGEWSPDKLYALQLTYLHDLSKDTMVDTAVGNIREQDVADKETMDRWEAQMAKVLPAVRDRDQLIGIAVPGKASLLFYNGKQIARITERPLSDAFFAIWLGDTADKTLRAKLLGNGQ